MFGKKDKTKLRRKSTVIWPLSHNGKFATLSRFSANVSSNRDNLRSFGGFERAFETLLSVDRFCKVEDVFYFTSGGKLYVKNGETVTKLADEGYSHGDFCIADVGGTKQVFFCGSQGIFTVGETPSLVLDENVTCHALASDRLFVLNSDGRVFFSEVLDFDCFTTAENAPNCIDFDEKVLKITAVDDCIYAATTGKIFKIEPNGSPVDFTKSTVFVGDVKPQTLGCLGAKPCFVSDGNLVTVSDSGTLSPVFDGIANFARNALYAVNPSGTYVLVFSAHFDGFLSRYDGNYALVCHNNLSYRVIALKNRHVFCGDGFFASDGTPYVFDTAPTDESLCIFTCDFLHKTTLTSITFESRLPLDVVVSSGNDTRVFHVSGGAVVPVKLAGTHFDVAFCGNFDVTRPVFDFDSVGGDFA